MRHFFLLLFLCLGSFFVQFSAGAQAVPAQLNIYAATSLTDVFEELAAAFSADQPEVQILLNFASSATLAAQLVAGAPADIFASANETQMQVVLDDGRIDADAVEIFAHNQLLLIAPADNPAQLESIADLAQPAVLLVVALPDTPIRVYTDAMLAAYNAEYGADFSDRVSQNIVSQESNVRQVVARVALGEADAGIVYQSDALGSVSQALHTISIDPQYNQLAAYPIAVLADSAQAALARQFVNFAQSEAARAILTAYGFCPPAIIDDELATAMPAEAEPTPDARLEPETTIAPCAFQPEQAASG